MHAIAHIGLLALTAAATTGCGTRHSPYISEHDAIEAALAGIDVEVLGIRFDEPDTQWDVFLRSGEEAFEVEVDAVTGAVVAAEAESLAEIQAELAGDLSHEGVAGDTDE